MDAETVIQGGGLVVSGALVAKAGDWFMAWLRSRNQKTEISPTPLPVEGEISKKQPFVTIGEFNRRMDETNARVTRIEGEIKANNDRVMQKLDEIDNRNEERSIKTHQRLDPLVEEIGRLRGKVEYIETAAVQATMGGKK